MDVSHYLLLLLGLVVVVFAVWCRSGRSEAARFWVGSDWNERAILLVVPSTGVVLVGAALLPLVEFAPGVRLALGFLVMLALAVGLWGALFLPVPGWMTPAWYRTATAYRTEAKRKAKERKRRARAGGDADAEGRGG